MTLLAAMDTNSESPTFETMMELAVASAFATVKMTETEADSSAIEYMLRAALVMATNKANDEDMDVEKVLPTFDTEAEAETAYRKAYASERGTSVEDLHSDLGYWPWDNVVPLFDGMPKSFVTRVARAEAASDAATSAMLRKMALASASA